MECRTRRSPDWKSRNQLATSAQQPASDTSACLSSGTSTRTTRPISPAETHRAAANAADGPETDASEATDNTEIHTAAVNAANAIDVNEDEAFKKPSGDMTAETGLQKYLNLPNN